ncbi:OsmC family protein [Variovorax sp. Sphag1AA]|uniref:OsmC family protein n=1 Tax=Variovorax sp. Sphag1AA TaxID=2587027 RepID=UPI001622661B|nr:OsmC family protein [Variovorax sp. Sphag1AA]MBB3181458.1 putative OsmC-like protein [Variovorax sp. Sphag1AA]
MSAVIDPNAPPATTHGEVVAIHAKALDTSGRFLVSARHNHFVSDAKASAGGPGEAVQAGELLLSSLASCGLALVQKEALAREVWLTRTEVEVRFERDPDDGTRYREIRLDFAIGGVELTVAQALVDAFTGACPIYNTLRRGGPIRANVRTLP